MILYCISMAFWSFTSGYTYTLEFLYTTDNSAIYAAGFFNNVQFFSYNSNTQNISTIAPWTEDVPNYEHTTELISILIQNYSNVVMHLKYGCRLNETTTELFSPNKINQTLELKNSIDYYLNHSCINQLNRYIDVSHNITFVRSPVTSLVMTYRPNQKLLCRAIDFFPPINIKASWYKDNQLISTTHQIRPSGNGYFQSSISTPFTFGDEHRYTCKITHLSDIFQLHFYWPKDLDSEENDENHDYHSVWLYRILYLLIALFVITFIYCCKTGIQEQLKLHDNTRYQRLDLLT
ncbi:membrane protein S12 [Saimiriine betaherpesvirus 4]|uniref:Membrane protein S12 n=1 Tax=Saimiriine betaherpesvirus 4 TaxID=1535247 RepID=G8XST3_9BETA|nr:membrane protein S12 [Saimiriine betaherpesvirus 4]AEV80880.1 membrane protein S12 [Saimiriine betaherpesvirus 4]